MSDLKAAIIIEPDPKNLRFVLKTTFQANRVILKSGMGTLDIMGGWCVITENDGFNTRELRETLITNIEQSVEQIFTDFGNEDVEINTDKYFEGIFTDIQLTDFHCTQLDEEGNYGELTVDITIEDHLKIASLLVAYRGLGLRPVI